MKNNGIVPFEATHPGTLLGAEIKERGLKQNNVAMELGLQQTFLNEVIKGKRAITADLAILLEKYFGITGEYWLRFQSQYELDCARIKEKNIKKTKEIEIWKLIKEYVPINQFTKLGLLTNNLSKNIERIWEIYVVNSIDELINSYSKHLNSAFYKKSDKLKADTKNIFGWSKFAQWKAKDETVAKFDIGYKDQLIDELKNSFLKNRNTISDVKVILQECGVKFLIVDKFKQVPIDGYSFWSENNPAIVVSLRKKILDSFAFTVMHELGHIFEHLQLDKLEEFIDIDDPKSSINQKEIEANKFARNVFIDELNWRSFIDNHSKFNYHTTEKEINELAGRLQIHPSIVLGRYCFETNNYKIKTSIERFIN